MYGLRQCGAWGGDESWRDASGVRKPRAIIDSPPKQCTQTQTMTMHSPASRGHPVKARTTPKELCARQIFDEVRQHGVPQLVLSVCVRAHLLERTDDSLKIIAAQLNLLSSLTRALRRKRHRRGSLVHRRRRLQTSRLKIRLKKRHREAQPSLDGISGFLAVHFIFNWCAK